MRLYINLISKPGDKLPSVTQLKERYQVSKSTIIKALGLLEQDGLIYQAQGSGIYVRNIADANRINVFKTNGFSKSLGEHRMTVRYLFLRRLQRHLNLYKMSSN